jgi:5'-3' exoribonuclease 1
MGIPSYFSHIVRNHSEIIKRLDKLKSINNIYLDSNSIIYDTLRIISKEYTGNDDAFEELLIQGVINKLDEYLHFIKPTGVVFIAFDGVAPVAKLEQQRTRRYKSYLLNDIRSKLDPTTENVWDKTAITPGTNFMKKLGEGITGHYIHGEKSYGANQIIVSTSQEPGEGEHKIFQYIRNRPKYHEKTNTLVYGLMRHIF